MKELRLRRPVGVIVVVAALVVAATAVAAHADPTPTGTATTTSEPTSSPTTTTPAPTTTVTVTAPPTTTTVTATPPTVTTTVTATPSPTTTTTPPPPTTPTAASTVWVFGDSIGAGGWLADPTQDWVDLVMARAAGDGIQVKNFSEGGTPFHRVNPAGHVPLINVMIDRFNEETTVPDVVVIAVGTNDIISHTLSVPSWNPTSVVSSMYAAIAVQQYLTGKGVKRIVWNTVYPFARHDQPAFNGASIPWYWLPELYQRTSYFNAWLYAMWGGDVVNTHDTLDDWEHPEQGNASYFIDGFHPTVQGHARIAASFPMSSLLP